MKIIEKYLLILKNYKNYKLNSQNILILAISDP